MRKILVLLIMIVGITCGSLSVNAESEFVNESDIPMGMYDSAFIENAYLSQELFYKLYLRYLNVSDSFSDSYAGAYIDESGELVIRLTSFSEEVIDTIDGFSTKSGYVLKEAEFNYKELTETIERVDRRIAALFEKTNQDLLPIDEKLLMAMYPCTAIDEVNNRIVISLYISDNVELSRGIALFEKIIEQSAMFTFESKPEPYGSACATTWRPGRRIFGVNSNTLAVNGGSTGYRVQCNVNGTVKHGFVTCGHGNAVGTSYFNIFENMSGTVNIGTVKKAYYGNNMLADVAFVEPNSNYVVSNAIYYTSSSGNTQQGTVLDGTYTVPAAGNRLYKSGATTYLTSEIIASIYASDYFTQPTGEVYYQYNLIRVDANIVDSGDSGGVAYVLNSSPNSGKVIGIVTAKKSTASFFTHAINISTYLGANPY